MPELDDFVQALREEADAVQPRSLLPSVRTRAHVLRRRRWVSATAGVVAAVLVAAGGAAWMHGPATTPAPGHRTVTSTDPAVLLGHTWYLQSWTAAGSDTAVLPDTDRPATLVFDSRTAAHTDDPVNTTTYTLTLGRGTLDGVTGPSTTVAENLATQRAFSAMNDALSGHTGWQVTGSQLVVRSAGGTTVTFTDDRDVALATGGLTVFVLARGYNPTYIPGAVRVRGPGHSDPAPVNVSTDGEHLSHLTPGTYHVSATVVGGSCQPASGTVVGGQTAQVTVRCLLTSSSVASLLGRTWYLQSWTSGGVASTPAVVPPPLLQLQGNRLTTGDGCNDTYWTDTLGAGTIRSVRGMSTASRGTPECDAVSAAISDALSGSATWAVTGQQLRLVGAPGTSLTYTSDRAAALAHGGVQVSVWSTHIRGPLSTATGFIPGDVTVSAASSGTRHAAATPQDPATFVGLSPGTYTVTTTVKGGSCTPTTAKVHGGSMTQVRVTCKDGLATD